METPPPFNPQYQQPKKSGVGWVIGIVSAVILIPCILVVAAGFFGKNWFDRELNPMISCMFDTTTVSKALRDYADAHDGKFPPAKTWQDEVRPFMAKARKQAMEDDSGDSAKIFELMDLDKPWGCKGKVLTAFTFNDSLSGKRRSDVLKDGNNPVVVFETTSVVPNAHGPYKENDKKNAPRMSGWVWITADLEVESSGGGSKMSVGSKRSSN